MVCDAGQMDTDPGHYSAPTSANSRSPQSKNDWVQRYADRVFALWLSRQTCLGVARQYIERLRADLGRYYEDPLKRTFIETTYAGAPIS